eukprot:603156_1
MMSPTSRRTKKRRHSKKRKIYQKRKREKKRNRWKNKNEPRSDSDIGGVFARVLGVGAFALALWLHVRPKGDTKSQAPSQSVSSSVSPSQTASPNNQSSLSPPENSEKNEIDTSEFGKPVTELSGAEMRQLLKTNLGRNYDESQHGQRYGEDEIEFMKKLHKSGVKNQILAEAFNRGGPSISKTIRRDQNEYGYAPRAKGENRPRTVYAPPMEWRAESALMKLPNWEGTTSQIFDLIQEEYRDLDCSIAAGNKTTCRWHSAVRWALSTNSLFQPVGKIGRQKIWRLYKSDDPDELMVNIKEGERKQRRKKGDFSKRMNKVKAYRK